jgi:hypothetical protein
MIKGAVTTASHSTESQMYSLPIFNFLKIITEVPRIESIIAMMRK